MTRTGHVDRSTVLKVGMLVSFALVVGGFVGSWAVSGTGAPAWEQTLFLDAEIVGTLGLLFFPLTFGIVLPLVE
ncbi:MAG: hypothetical protein ACQEQY_05285 [Halobacteriota archaeon]